MGTVWVAEQSELRRSVAVKFLSGSAPFDETARKRFAREAKSAARLDGPHVVQIYEYGATEDGVPYIVMELLEGEDLAEYLARTGRLTPTDTLDIVLQIAEALHMAHGLGVVHRDIKPANVFLTYAGAQRVIKVLDFGLAKHEHEPEKFTTTGEIFGTPHYMSPEQGRNAKTVTRSADLWSLAVVAYQCLTGALPFDADTLMGLCFAIQEATFVPPSSLCSDLPADVDAWFARALARDSKDRFPTILAMVDALKSTLHLAISDAGLITMIADEPRRGPRAARRAYGAAAGVLLAAGVAWTARTIWRTGTLGAPFAVRSPPGERSGTVSARHAPRIVFFADEGATGSFAGDGGLPLGAALPPRLLRDPLEPKGRYARISVVTPKNVSDASSPCGVLEPALDAVEACLDHLQAVEPWPITAPARGDEYSIRWRASGEVTAVRTIDGRPARPIGACIELTLGAARSTAPAARTACEIYVHFDSYPAP